MKMKDALLIGLAGMFGAVLRTAIGFAIGEGNSFPIATFSVNLLATWLICFMATGMLNQILKSQQVRDMMTVGFLGSFSTFSTFSIETVLLFESGQLLIAVLYIGASIIGGLGVGMFGFYCGRKWMKT